MIPYQSLWIDEQNMVTYSDSRSFATEIEDGKDCNNTKLVLAWRQQLKGFLSWEYMLSEYLYELFYEVLR